MAVAVVQSTNAVISTGSGTWTFTFASAVAQNNVVVLIAKNGTNNRTLQTPTGGGGTFSAIQTNGGTAVGALYLWSKSESNTGVTSYTITIATNTSIGVVYGWELSGTNGASAASSGTGTQSTATTSPQMVDTGLTVASGGIMIGAISTQVFNTWGTFTTPTNFTSRYQSTASPASSVFFGDSTTAASGVTGQATTTTSRAVYGLAATWIQPATGGPFPFYTQPKMLGGMASMRGGY